jgi:hypothetical protein
VFLHQERELRTVDGHELRGRRRHRGRRSSAGVDQRHLTQNPAFPDGLDDGAAHDHVDATLGHGEHHFAGVALFEDGLTGLERFRVGRVREEIDGHAELAPFVDESQGHGEDYCGSR